MSDRPTSVAAVHEAPPSDIAEFIRFCHARRAVGWPDLYDEMCAVASRREFRGWDQDELAARGLTFSLTRVARLAGWVRTVLGPSADAPSPLPIEPPIDRRRRRTRAAADN
ncbi:MAG TPA: hypothetical protein VHK06_06190 [Candidatus Limnocylindria bacterium]|nr:hypothetical protein [Candidatus Limnocylindria bacterium]